MPPRISGANGLKSFTLPLRPAARSAAPSLQPLIQTAEKHFLRPGLSREEKKRMKKQDPYRWNQIQAKKAAHVRQQEAAHARHDASWGSPIHGIPTPFVESFASAGQASHSTPKLDRNGQPIGEPIELPTSPNVRSMLLSADEVKSALDWSYELNKPLQEALSDPVREEQEKREHEARHSKAQIVLDRITALENSGAKHRKHANIERCVQTFGRHVTDQTLRLPPRGPRNEGEEAFVKTPRAGPDTGSSEVQIAILTAKITRLGQLFADGKNKHDKHNWRNLRNLCHRRQALLRYMERKEQGSERWTHLIQTLGLSPATWKEQISF